MRAAFGLHMTYIYPIRTFSSIDASDHWLPHQSLSKWHSRGCRVVSTSCGTLKSLLTSSDIYTPSKLSNTQLIVISVVVSAIFVFEKPSRRIPLRQSVPISQLPCFSAVSNQTHCFLSFQAWWAFVCRPCRQTVVVWCLWTLLKT